MSNSNHQKLPVSSELPAFSEQQLAEMATWNPEDFAVALASFGSACRALPPGTVIHKTDIYYESPAS